MLKTNSFKNQTKKKLSTHHSTKFSFSPQNSSKKSSTTQNMHYQSLSIIQRFSFLKNSFSKKKKNWICRQICQSVLFFHFSIRSLFRLLRKKNIELYLLGIARLTKKSLKVDYSYDRNQDCGCSWKIDLSLKQVLVSLFFWVFAEFLFGNLNY